MEQKIRVTTCHLTGCQDSLDVQTKEVIRAYLLHIQTVVVASLYRAAPYGIRALDTLKDGAVDAMVLLRRVRHAVPLLFASQASARSGPTETMLGRWPGSDPARRSMIEESQMHLHLHGPQMLAAIP